MKLLNSEKLTAKDYINILYIILVKLADKFFKFEKKIFIKNCEVLMNTS